MVKSLAAPLCGCRKHLPRVGRGDQVSDAADPNVPDKGAFLPGSAAYGKQPTKVPQVLDVDGDGEVTVEALNGQWQNPQGIGAAELLDVLRIRQQWSGLTDDA